MSVTAINNTFASLLNRSLFNFYDSKLAVGYLQFISWQEKGLFLERPKLDSNISPVKR